MAKPGKSTVKLYFNSMNEIMNEVNKYNYFQLNNSLKSHPWSNTCHNIDNIYDILKVLGTSQPKSSM